MSARSATTRRSRPRRRRAARSASPSSRPSSPRPSTRRTTSTSTTTTSTLRRSTTASAATASSCSSTTRQRATRRSAAPTAASRTSCVGRVGRGARRRRPVRGGREEEEVWAVRARQVDPPGLVPLDRLARWVLSSVGGSGWSLGRSLLACVCVCGSSVLSVRGAVSLPLLLSLSLPPSLFSLSPSLSSPRITRNLSPSSSHAVSLSSSSRRAPPSSSSLVRGTSPSSPFRTTHLSLATLCMTSFPLSFSSSSSVSELARRDRL